MRRLYIFQRGNVKRWIIETLRTSSWRTVRKKEVCAPLTQFTGCRGCVGVASPSQGYRGGSWPEKRGQPSAYPGEHRRAAEFLSRLRAWYALPKHPGQLCRLPYPPGFLFLKIGSKRPGSGGRGARVQWQKSFGSWDVNERVSTERTEPFRRGFSVKRDFCKI